MSAMLTANVTLQTTCAPITQKRTFYRYYQRSRAEAARLGAFKNPNHITLKPTTYLCT